MKRKLYYGGTILTMCGEHDRVEAVLTEGGRIFKVGSREELMPLADECFDLKGKTLMPSFIDTHSHYSQIARNNGQVNLFGCTDIPDILERVKRFAQERKLPPDSVIIGRGYDNKLFPGMRQPTKKELDTIDIPNPILVVHCDCHSGACSSKALEQTTIHDWFADMMGRDEDGTPNGFFEEAAFTAVRTELGFYSPKVQGQYLRKAQDLYLSYGITTVNDSCVQRGIIEYERDADLSIDVICQINRPIDWTPAEVGDQEYCNHVRLGGYKLILDGTVVGRSAYCTAPYTGTQDYGYPLFTQEQLDEYVRISIDHGRQLHVHCIGDAAAEMFISAYEKAVAQGGRRDLRPLMVHSTFVTEEQLERMAKLPMLATFMSIGIYTEGDVGVSLVGPEVGARANPIASAMRLGVHSTIHQDAPVNIPDMMGSVWAAVNRISASGKVLCPQERITPYQALECITTKAAYQFFEENEKGTIEPGKRADMVILSANPLEVPATEIRNITVEHTIKDGKAVWSAEK